MAANAKTKPRAKPAPGTDLIHLRTAGEQEFNEAWTRYLGMHAAEVGSRKELSYVAFQAGVTAQVRIQTRLNEKIEGQDSPRPHYLDSAPYILALRRTLSGANGKLSASKIAALYGETQASLGSLCRIHNISMDNLLEYFERVARIRMVFGDSDSDSRIPERFRTWVANENSGLMGRRPIIMLYNGQFRAIADFVHSVLSGNPASPEA